MPGHRPNSNLCLDDLLCVLLLARLPGKMLIMQYEVQQASQFHRYDTSLWVGECVSSQRAQVRAHVRKSLLNH